ncbi:hypothetical protein [Paenarthrobacter sp. NPDC058040]|uniref:hypothetical protein n=1 Tax=unclassified Paenarthrobacter TaxID=2634190 RepID=UPI0036DB65EE
MNKPIAESTAAIEEHLLRLDRPTLQLLNPGISSELVATELTQRGLHAGEDLIALFAWRNGTRAGPAILLDDMWLMPGYYLLTFEDALHTYDRFVNEHGENRLWFPVLTTESGCWVFVDCSNATDQPVYHFTFEDPDHEQRHSSIKDMLAGIAEGFARGVFFVDADGWFDMDDDAFWALARELNPGSSYWIE